MKNLVLSILFLLPISISAKSIQRVTNIFSVEFSCIIPGHGGGCSVESYSLNAPDQTVFVKVFTSFRADGIVESSELETMNIDYLKLITPVHTGSYSDEFLMIGTDETIGNILFFNSDKQLIETRRVTFKPTFTEEY